MKSVYNFIILLASIVLFFACDIKDSDQKPSANFTHLYESNNIQEVYYPTDIIQTEDNGFLILSGLFDKSDEIAVYPKIHVIKTDETGKFIWQTVLENAFQSAVPKFLVFEGNTYVICMNSSNDFKTTLLNLEIGKEGAKVNLMGADPARRFPLAAHAGNNGEIVVLSYDDEKTHIDGYDHAFQNIWHVSISARGLEDEVSKHLGKRSGELPFFITETETGQKYYIVNSYSISSLSLIFVKSTGNSAEISGRLAGFQDEGVFSSACHLQDNVFAVSRYYLGDNFIYPGVVINLEASELSTDFTDIPLVELSNNAKFKVMKTIIDEKELIVYASTTSTNQIAIYFYNSTEYKLVKTHYLGHTNPVEVASMMSAKDGSMVILGVTRVAGRYQRPILYKVSLEELGF